MKNLEEFKQICAGPVWDGDLVSKAGRDALVEAGYVVRRDGWNLLSVDGVAVAMAFGLLSTNRAAKGGFGLPGEVYQELFGDRPKLRSRVLARLKRELGIGDELILALNPGHRLRIVANEQEADAFDFFQTYRVGPLSVRLHCRSQVGPGEIQLDFVVLLETVPVVGQSALQRIADLTPLVLVPMARYHGWQYSDTFGSVRVREPQRWEPITVKLTREDWQAISTGDVVTSRGVNVVVGRKSHTNDGGYTVRLDFFEKIYVD